MRFTGSFRLLVCKKCQAVLTGGRRPRDPSVGDQGVAGQEEGRDEGPTARAAAMSSSAWREGTTDSKRVAHPRHPRGPGMR